MTTGELETEIRRDFEVREEPFAHRDFHVTLLLPKRADALIDEAAYAIDERLPYWADLWPSARALARHLIENPPPRGTSVVELGSGVALPSLALLHVGLDPLATDWYDDALTFGRGNAERNGLGTLRTSNLDWFHPPEGERWELVVTADVLYEKRNAESLAALLPRIVAPGGRALVADPGRSHAPDFRNLMYFAGWRVHDIDVREEESDPVTGRTSTVRIWEVTRAGGANGESPPTLTPGE